MKMELNAAKGARRQSISTRVSKWFTGRRDSTQPRGLEAHIEAHWVVIPGRPRAVRRFLFVVCALLLGAALLERDTLWGGVAADAWWTTVKNGILDHIGSAFLVSAIVIVAFEWASESKSASSLAATLAKILDGQIQAVIKASSRDAIARAMKDLCGKQGDDLEDQFTEFADAIARLGERGGWAADGYLKFIAWYHKQLCDKVGKLADLNTALKNHPEAAQEFPFPLPDASDVADVMLAKTTSSMAAAGGGNYYALSDAFTWTKLTEFRQMLREAAEKNVEIRRLFVVGKPSDRDLTMTELASVIYDHFEEAQNCPRYDMRIIDENEYRHNEPAELSHMLHFGIFEPSIEETPVMFIVLKSELSDYRIAGGTKAERAITAFSNLFERFPQFRELPAYTQLSRDEKHKRRTISGDILIRDYLIAYRVKRMRSSGRYRGVSDITLWKNGELEHFHAACNEKLGSTGVDLKRIFFFPKIELADDADVIEVLRRHLIDAAPGPSRPGKYEWQVCMESTLPDSIREEGTFGTFIDLESDEGQIVGEVAIKKVRHLFAQDKATFRKLTENFGKFWKSLSAIDANKELATRLERNDAPFQSGSVDLQSD